MVKISVDNDKCIRDGLCEQICPLRLIRCGDGPSFVQTVRDFQAWCIQCGHCVAVCPSGALSHSSISSENCSPLSPTQILSPDLFENFLQNRRSIRRFKTKVPDRTLIKRMISMGCYAPSGHNRQPVKWSVFDDPENIMHMAGKAVDWMVNMLETHPESPQSPLLKKVIQAWKNKQDLVLHHTPCLVIGYCQTVTGTESIDTAAAFSYLELAALSLGLGCCWAGVFLMAMKDWKPLRDVLDLPKGHEVYGAMLVGYPRYSFQRSSPRNSPDILWKNRITNEKT